MKNHVVWRLLRRNISAGQLAGYALANLAGLAIVLVALQFYRDVTAAWDSEDSFISRDYLIISRKVSGLSSIIGSSNKGFSQADISDIEAQGWTRRVGRFTPSAFGVGASVEMGGRGLNTSLFLESIPDEFFDALPSGWGYEPGSGQPVPVVISKDYLTLYNFGYASSRGLPQVSEAMVGMVPLRLSVSGAGKQAWLPAKIVGFSSRLNTIAVPEQFMQWANSEFADGAPENPQRLIIEVNTPGDPAIEKYLSAHSYESAGDKADNGRAAYFLSVVTAVVIAVGAVISLLALFILLLSIYLLLQKNREKIHTLMMLGYTPAQVGRYYRLVVAAVNVAVLLLAIAAMFVASAFWRVPLESIGVHHSSPWLSVIAGVAVTAIITAINFFAISRKIRSAYP